MFVRCCKPCTGCTRKGYNLFSLLFDKVVMLAKKCDECWLMGYHVRYPTRPPHPAHCDFHANNYMRHDSACFSQITMQCFKYTSVS
jgi:hypothetical protein